MVTFSYKKCHDLNSQFPQTGQLNLRPIWNWPKSPEVCVGFGSEWAPKQIEYCKN